MFYDYVKGSFEWRRNVDIVEGCLVPKAEAQIYHFYSWSATNFGYLKTSAEKICQSQCNKKYSSDFYYSFQISILIVRFNMPTIFVECEYVLAKSNKNSEPDENFIFQKFVNGVVLEVDVAYSRGTALARVSGAEISQEQVDELLKYKSLEGGELSASCYEAIRSVSALASGFTRQILSTIKYHLEHIDFSEHTFTVKSEKWGLTSSDLRHIPASISVAVSARSTCPLRQDSYEMVKASLSADIEPLTAMRHLHRAIQESVPHYKWIDATIAAELAIKETLSRANPALECLLLELPSPPLSKLYGKVMKEYLGEESPYKKSIIKGAEIRNLLIHRHDGKSIDTQEAINYVKEVERTIFHLLSLLYPSDELIQLAYARKKY